MVNYGFFNYRLFPTCSYCMERNGRTHVTDYCSQIEEIKEDTIKELKIIGVNTNESELERTLIRLYYQPSGNSTRVSKSIEIMKKFVSRLYIERRWLNLNENLL